MVTDIKKLLEIRKKVKARKPTYVRQDINKKKRLDVRWRSPKGIQSKVRENRRGRRSQPETGFGAPRLVEGTSPEGKQVILVHTLEQTKVVNAQKQAVILASGVGLKKKEQMIKHCAEHKITILNLTDANAFLGKRLADLAQVKKSREARKQKQEAALKAAAAKPAKKEKAASAPKADEAQPVEDAKDEEKKEKDKVLTKRT